MGDFIPEEELQTFLSKTTPGARIPPPEDRNKIGSSNVGHKLLSKMGWTEGGEALHKISKLRLRTSVLHAEPQFLNVSPFWIVVSLLASSCCGL